MPHCTKDRKRDHNFDNQPSVATYLSKPSTLGAEEKSEVLQNLEVLKNDSHRPEPRVSRYKDGRVNSAPGCTYSVCVYIYMYICSHIDARAYAYAYIIIHIYMYIYIYIYADVCIHTYTCTYIHVFMYTFVYIFTCIHMSTNTYMHMNSHPHEQVYSVYICAYVQM